MISPRKISRVIREGVYERDSGLRHGSTHRSSPSPISLARPVDRRRRNRRRRLRDAIRAVGWRDDNRGENVNDTSAARI